MGGVSGVRITLLCEDSQTDTFVRRFPRRRKFRGRDIRTLPLPHGTGSGEQWVRQRYPVELRAMRAVQNAYLIVVTGAYIGSTQARRAQLEAECEREGVPRIREDERVLVIVPRRNIETWLAYLERKDVDESSSPHPSPIRDFEFTLLVLDADWVAIPVVGRSALRSRVFGPCQERLLPVHRATLTWIANGGRAPTSASRRCSVNAVQRWSSYPGSRHSGSRCRFASTSAKTLA